MRTQDIWDIDCFYSPFAVEDQTRPYYPLTYLCVDRGSYKILDTLLLENKDCSSVILDSFLRMIKDTNILPKKICVKNDNIFQIFSPLANQLGIIIDFDYSFEVMEMLKAVMFGLFNA